MNSASRVTVVHVPNAEFLRAWCGPDVVNTPDVSIMALSVARVVVPGLRVNGGAVSVSFNGQTLSL